MGNVMYMRKGEVHREPIAGVRASALAVGSTVYLMETGSAVEYIVVNQGIPSNSDIYDPSCDGTWLLRKDFAGTTSWNLNGNNNYKVASVHTYLNGSFFGRFDTDLQTAIKPVKIPYINGTGSSEIASGADGLLTKIFLLSGHEVGFTRDLNQYLSEEGACLSYFEGEADINNKRIVYVNGSLKAWWLRSVNIRNTTDAFGVDTEGSLTGFTCTDAYGVRPALVLPYTARFDKETMVFKGVP